MRKVKIVCTLGPSTEGVEKLLGLIEAGMDVARFNFSHGDYEYHKKMYEDLRTASKKIGKPVAVLGDLCGPKIRVGMLKNGAVSLRINQKIILTTDNIEGDENRVPHTYINLSRDVKKGDPILFDDGLLETVVESTQGNDVICKVIVGGVLKNKKGMNLPSTKFSISALTEKDKKDIEFGKILGVDIFALSFVRNANDIKQAKTLAGNIPVIAKLEKPEAIESLAEILEVSDGAMVARGDLGVEAGHEKVPLIQKRIIKEIKSYAKPVITATQMLDSMINNPSPTRAEVSDVANAVLDGTDAVMLSGETAVGKYPIQAVNTLAKVIKEVEQSGYFTGCLKNETASNELSFSNAMADAAVEVAKHLNLTAISVYSESGKSVAQVSAYRPKASIIAFSRHESVLNRLSLYWGVRPLYGAWVSGVNGVVEQVERELLGHKLALPGDNVVITFGMVIGNEMFQTNMMKLWKVR